MTIAIGSDHGGFLLKQHIIAFLKKQGLSVRDLGPENDSPVDYPDFALKVALDVAAHAAETGIIIDGAGVGSSIVANKLPGIRAALCNDLYTARNAREHNNANILVMGSMVIGLGMAEKIVDTFLKTAFAGGRHERRVKKIDCIDQKYRSNGASTAEQSVEDIVGAIVKKFLQQTAPKPVEPLPVIPVQKGQRIQKALRVAKKSNLITEETIKLLVRQGSQEITVSRRDIITPLAHDSIREHRMTILYREEGGD